MKVHRTPPKESTKITLDPIEADWLACALDDYIDMPEVNDRAEQEYLKFLRKLYSKLSA
jgi:hypothetical protein